MWDEPHPDTLGALPVPGTDNTETNKSIDSLDFTLVTTSTCQRTSQGEAPAFWNRAANPNLFGIW